MILSIFSESPFPWGELLAGVGTFIILLLSIGNNKLKKILAETKVNGGSSLKDQMNRMENSLSNLALWVEAGHHLNDKPTFRTDSRGNFVWVNDAFISLTGRSLESLQNLGWISAVLDEDRHRVFEEWSQAVKDKRSFQLDFKILTNTDEIKEVRARACPTNGNSAFLGYLGYWLVLEEMGFK